jgi:hypothetical protein
VRHSCAPAQPTPSTFSAGFARHLLMMVFASTAWHSPICLWQETIGGTSGTLSATSGSWLCDCRWERERALQLKLLRRLCPSPSPNLLMPGVTAQMRSRTWQLQFWMARHGETDAVSVPLFLLSNCVIYHHIAFLLLSYTTISRNFAYLTLTYRLYRSNTSFSRSQEGGNAHSILHSILNHIIVY